MSDVASKGWSIVGSGCGLTPTTRTSYFSSELFSGSNVGARRGSGGAKDGRTRRSREEDAFSVKTGILGMIIKMSRNQLRSVTYLVGTWVPMHTYTCFGSAVIALRLRGSIIPHSLEELLCGEREYALIPGASNYMMTLYGQDTFSSCQDYCTSREMYRAKTEVYCVTFYDNRIGSDITQYFEVQLRIT